MIRAFLSHDNAPTAHSRPDCGALAKRPSWGGAPVEVEVFPPGDRDTVYLRTVPGPGRELKLCRKCWTR